MKRALRIAWVVVANSAVIGFLVSPHWPPNGHLENSVNLPELILEFFFPAMGIVVELLDWKIARWINVGYLLVIAGFWFTGAIWWRRDVWFFAFLLIGLGFLTLAAITHAVYQKTLSSKSIPSTPEPH